MGPFSSQQREVDPSAFATVSDYLLDRLFYRIGSMHFHLSRIITRELCENNECLVTLELLPFVVNVYSIVIV